MSKCPLEETHRYTRWSSLIAPHFFRSKCPSFELSSICHVSQDLAEKLESVLSSRTARGDLGVG